MQKGRSLIRMEKNDNTLGKDVTSCECKKVIADIFYKTKFSIDLKIQVKTHNSEFR